MTTGIISSSIGPLRATVVDGALRQLQFSGDDHSLEEGALTGDVAEQIAAYFAGQLHTFSLPVDLSGVSGFTRKVLQATSAIPYGETVTYGEIAQRIGMPGATQAVGNALGANPVPIVIPCHRVVRSDGSMGWFTGGPHIKKALLRIEGVEFPEQQSLPI